MYWMGIWWLLEAKKSRNGSDTRHSGRLLRTCHSPTGHSVPQDWYLHHRTPTILVLGSTVIGHALCPYRHSSLHSHQEASLIGLNCVVTPSGYKVQVAAFDWLCLGLVLAHTPRGITALLASIVEGGCFSIIILGFLPDR